MFNHNPKRLVNDGTIFDIVYEYDVNFCITKACITNTKTGDYVIYPMESETIPEKVLDYYINKLLNKED